LLTKAGDEGVDVGEGDVAMETAGRGRDSWMDVDREGGEVTTT